MKMGKEKARRLDNMHMHALLCFNISPCLSLHSSDSEYEDIPDGYDLSPTENVQGSYSRQNVWSGVPEPGKLSFTKLINSEKNE